VADNVTITEGTGTTIAADEIASVKHQRVKIEWGVDGVATDVSASSPLPVVQTGAAILPTDAATQTTLAAVLAKLSADPSTETTLAAILAKIIAAPATSAKQDALAALIGEVQASPTSNTVLDRLKSIQTALTGTLAISAASLPLPTGASTEATLSTLNGKVPALGQALAAASTPVVLTAIQQAALTPPAAITGFATVAKQPALGTAGTPSVDVITVQGATTGTPIPTKAARSSTATHTNVGGSASSVTVLASNANRLGASVFNDSTAILYLDTTGGTASATNYTVQIGASAYFEMPFGYTGAITGIWASATGSARVVEYT
jgi:hypothetical protein